MPREGAAQQQPVGLPQLLKNRVYLLLLLPVTALLEW